MSRLRQEILRAFLERRDILSGEELSKGLGVSRSSIWKHIQGLRDQGYQILSCPKLGYRLVVRPDGLLPAEIRAGLSTEIIGKEILHFKEISSTNDLGLKLARQGYPEGTLIIAECQSCGRGRLDRSWVSPEGGIYLSLILRPQASPDRVPFLTLLAGVAVAKGIKKILNLPLLLKWPNDLLINGKKVSGILTEMEAELDKVNFTVVGIGINVNVRADQLPERPDYPAISLMVEMGREVDRRPLLQEILLAIEDGYLEFKAGNYTSILEAYRELDGILGKKAKIKTLQGVIEGEAEGIEKDGALRLRLSNGRVKRIRSGEVIL